MLSEGAGREGNLNLHTKGQVKCLKSGSSFCSSLM